MALQFWCHVCSDYVSVRENEETEEKECLYVRAQRVMCVPDALRAVKAR
jgi:hypothetical protein